MKPSAILTSASERAQQTQADPRWADVCARNAGADGRFVYAVRSTGVFCRPSCSSRQAKPENVSFFDSPALAQAAGYRACKRCQPDAPSKPGHAALMAQLCHWIATAEEEPNLADLAERAGMSPFHLQRVFKAAVGVSPKAYAKAQRRERLQAALGDAQEAPRVIDAIFDAGFASTAQLYRDSQAVLGMTPRQYRTGGAAQHIRFGVGECSLGPILVAATEQGICAILLGDDADALVQELQQRFPKAQLAGGDAAFERWMAQVIGFVDEPTRGLALPLDVRGTAFQQQVWQALRRIPVGSTVSYSELARTLGMPQASRAVAGACAANAIAVAIPCHRVVRSDGEISGYRWGVDRKRALLRHEAELAPQALRVARHG
ncbi:AraC family transcriptional regulator of adaptative response/methylated-DNA-[protein]-cysteine methyltransferase [Comamonas odontotermitis]|uniref:AraC family transcriptional regulator of adaptative response/methylated-DNA-[protein]-cysteine methyltransferase n=1 Tax=Comamonas odontotermitis TaxID=379895 RepID=A0ABR6RCY8_9BURK|nr:bifunctional DNA-binding transcriptional regulator/O6-methylguanine-DNA methyltransferase Ada [Comamonas odontotermitis]MBB6577026.1 AraC family transcriptional regulator of adaptative response/methylated-DNA-[protein]-cysteine methyltransferase [Comamonas odontotermitis]